MFSFLSSLDCWPVWTSNLAILEHFNRLVTTCIFIPPFSVDRLVSRARQSLPTAKEPFCCFRSTCSLLTSLKRSKSDQSLISLFMVPWHCHDNLRRSHYGPCLQTPCNSLRPLTMRPFTRANHSLLLERVFNVIRMSLALQISAIRPIRPGDRLMEFGGRALPCANLNSIDLAPISKPFVSGRAESAGIVGADRSQMIGFLRSLWTVRRCRSSKLIDRLHKKHNVRCR